jgi:hypothetical protein
MIKKDQRN